MNYWAVFLSVEQVLQATLQGPFSFKHGLSLTTPPKINLLQLSIIFVLG